MQAEERFHTLVFGASLKEYRISNQVIHRLRNAMHPVTAIGLRPGKVADVELQTGHPDLEGIHTITVYMNASRQQAHMDYLLSLHPKRIIFNPGAENHALFSLAKARGIEVENACTLVMLSTGEYNFPAMK